MRRILAAAVLALLAFGAAGCRTIGFWVEDVSNHVTVMRRDLNSVHRTFDRYFLNYDWEDPYL
ncbi:MAG TPA: hypothetical protein VFI25_03325 [Planctomycetota bacterium]|jgi:predicted small secreted protein|nr:hypothetical protein [Planctomycetota bacterium]